MRSPEELLAQTREEWDEMVKNFTHEELFEYLREFHEAFSKDPEKYHLTAEGLEELRQRLSGCEQSVKRVKVAERELAILEAEAAGPFDDILLHAPEKTRLYTPIKRLLKKKG